MTKNSYMGDERVNEKENLTNALWVELYDARHPKQGFRLGDYSAFACVNAEEVPVLVAWLRKTYPEAFSEKAPAPSVGQANPVEFVGSGIMPAFAKRELSGNLAIASSKGAYDRGMLGCLYSEEIPAFLCWLREAYPEHFPGVAAPVASSMSDDALAAYERGVVDALAFVRGGGRA